MKSEVGNVYDIVSWMLFVACVLLCPAKAAIDVFQQSFLAAFS